MKKIILLIATAIVIAMMAATLVESTKGSAFVGEKIYGAWWFIALWAALAGVGLVDIIKKKLYKRGAAFMLHASFVLILVGALTTHLTSETGQVHLRYDETNTQLGFPIELKRFQVNYYPGTDAPMDYSSIIIADGEELNISMNNIGKHKGYRFYQSSYDSDFQGSLLSFSYDPWGIGITYTGYLLLFLSFAWVLFSRHSRIRNLYKVATSNTTRIIAAMMFMLSLPSASYAETRVPSKEICDRMGEVAVLYNTRICPVNTVATDFVTKLTGKPTWNGYSANEIFAGWTFFFNYWEDAKMFRIKDKRAQQLLGIKDQWASFNDFWDEYNEYKLQGALNKAYLVGDKDEIKHLKDADEKFNIIRMFYNGEMLRIFPFTAKGGNTQWFSPGTTELPDSMDGKEWEFIRKSMDYLNESIMLKDNARALTLIKKISDYQRVRAKDVMPSTTAMKAEIVYNSIHSQRWPVMLALTCGFIIFILAIKTDSRKVRMIIRLYLALLLLWLTTILALRYYISGHLPLSNGYETMQFLAWSLVVITIIAHRKSPIVLAFGPMLAAFALLVAMIGGGNPQITKLMPVLNSPLLSIHVMVIMFAYALFALMAFIGIYSLCIKNHEEKNRLAALNLLMLYPAEFMLVVGIFIGAIWANVSWGRYWGWDPKETWALITMLVYALPFHNFKILKEPRNLHIYFIVAFISVLMTYFGVNYFLSGMHSYSQM